MNVVARLRVSLPLVVSLLAHAALVVWLLRAPTVATDQAAAAPEAWAGDTFDLELVGLEKGRGAEAPLVAAAPPGDAPLATAPVEALPAVVSPAAAVPAPKAPVPRPPAKQKDKAVDERAPASPPAPAAAQPVAANLHTKKAGRAAGPGADKPGEAGDGRPKGGTFGAEGPSAARDLGNAFARAIAPANQADAAWSKLPTGPAGTLDVAVTVDAEGHVGEVEPVSKTASPLLLSLAKRTTLLLRGGVFHLKRGEASAGRQVLRLRADVSDVDATAVQGGTIDLAFAYERGHGKAAFTRPGGRHVEIEVTLLRVEAAPAL